MSTTGCNKPEGDHWRQQRWTASGAAKAQQGRHESGHEPATVNAFGLPSYCSYTHTYLRRPSAMNETRTTTAIAQNDSRLSRINSRVGGVSAKDKFGSIENCWLKYICTALPTHICTMDRKSNCLWFKNSV